MLVAVNTRINDSLATEGEIKGMYYQCALFGKYFSRVFVMKILNDTDLKLSVNVRKKRH